MNWFPVSTSTVSISVALLFLIPVPIVLAQNGAVGQAELGVVADERVPGIDWVADLETAMKMSREDGRPVIAYFTFDACVWCKRLEKACYSDERVVELSRKFIWVTVNRDHTPEPPERLNVSAYPSLLTLGKDSENIYRFESYQEPPEFIGNLEKALQRYALYKNGEEWMLPPERPARIIDSGKVDLIRAPSESVPGGLAVMGDTIWVAQDDLYQIDPGTGRVIAQHSLPKSVGDLCSDGQQLFAMTYGWTAGEPIYVIDPANGQVVREIVTEANREIRSHGAKGIAWRDGHLYVLSGMTGTVSKLDVESGEVVGETKLDGTWLAGLDFHGANFVCGSRTHLYEFDAGTGKTIRQIDCNYPLRNVAMFGDDVLMMEQPIFGYGRRHERIQVWPQETQIHRWTEAK